MTVRAARRIPDLEPGSDQWLRLMTASKVSAVLGLSPWESRFTLWHRMAGYLPKEEGNERTERGHYLEDAVARWFGDQRTDLRVGRTGSWVNKARPWQSATPDRLLFSGRKAHGVLECKTSGSSDEYGPDGSDEIPPNYRVQIIWQCDTLGLPIGYLAVLLPRLVFRAYFVQPEPGEAEWIRDEVRAFLDTLPGGPNECVPDIDSTDSTYEAVRRLHVDIEDREVEVDPQLARRFLTTVQDAKDAAAAAQLVKTEMTVAMGNARRAVIPREGLSPLVVASRQAKGDNPPYVVAAKNVDLTDLFGRHTGTVPQSAYASEVDFPADQTTTDAQGSRVDGDASPTPKGLP